MKKLATPPGNLANGAVYLIEPEVLQWLKDNPLKSDFTTDVLPNYAGRIATWENKGIHRDIGVEESLLSAQSDPAPELFWPDKDDWQLEFEQHPIQRMVESLSK